MSRCPSTRAMCSCSSMWPKGPGEVSWNFEKFMIDRKGNVVARFDPRTAPSDSGLVALLQMELEKK